MAQETPDAASDVLTIEGVTKHFQSGKRTVTALKNVSVRVAGGAVTGLIGPDGAGKTTLMRLIAGLLVPDSGAIQVLEEMLEQENGDADDET